MQPLKGQRVGGRAEKVGGGQSVNLGIRGEKKIVEDVEHYSFSHVAFVDFHHPVL